ncbi:MAG: hypothetical protein ACRD3D_16535 [Terriglobia bacterium]
MKKLAVLVVVLAGVAAWYLYIYAPAKRRRAASEVAYVLPDSLPVFDTTAVIRRVLVTYHSGQAVRVAARVGGWAKLALPGGGTGWVHQADLVDSATYEKGLALIRAIASRQAQANGHTIRPVSIRLAPSRNSLKLGEFASDTALDVYDRRIIEASPNPGASRRKDVWYLVSGGQRGGWILGRFVDLDVPLGLQPYAQGINMVAWLVLDTVNDGGRAVPQYLAADRIGVENFDFNHIRVFTWWVKRHKYVTAYVESGVDGFFPITVMHEGSVPYFRLRLVDNQGDKYQKVYGLFDTIVKRMGTVEGWTSGAMPEPAKRARRHRRRRRSRATL